MMMIEKRNAIALAILGLIVFLAACAGDSASESADSLVDAKAVYQKYCVLCHGADGKLGLNGAMDLTVTEMSLQERIVLIRDGRNLMTPFKGILTDEEIEATARHTITFVGK